MPIYVSNLFYEQDNITINEAISKKRLGFLARHKGARKQSIQVVYEHFE
jgi:hypothetical protein